jgi:short chain dehydrogenase
MLQKADEGHIVNTSSVNGFWASVGPRVPHTSYSAAKFAVKGFTEALIADLKINAPHIKCSVVMPGHIGTGIASNSRKIHSGSDSDAITERQVGFARARIASMGRDVSGMSDEDIQKIIAERERRFTEDAPTSAAEAATIILDGVKADRWRILVGPDAQIIDEMVRASPEQAYDTDFFENFATKAAGASRRKRRRATNPVRKFVGLVLAISSCHTGAGRYLRRRWVSTFERVKKCQTSSFRGAGIAREPGTHEHRTSNILEIQVFSCCPLCHPLGRPSTRSPMMLRWISLVPPAIVY